VILLSKEDLEKISDALIEYLQQMRSHAGYFRNVQSVVVDEIQRTQQLHSKICSYLPD
jgi:hypothetical protein